MASAGTENEMLVAATAAANARQLSPDVRVGPVMARSIPLVGVGEVVQSPSAQARMPARFANRCERMAGSSQLERWEDAF